MRGARVVLVVAVLLAGCSGALGDETPASTVTPVDVPAAGGTPAAVPGVGDGVLLDPAALVAAHESRLAGVSYTRVWTERSESGDERRWEMTARVKVAPDGRRHTVVTFEGPDQPATIPPEATRVERFSTPDVTWTAVWRGEERTVTRRHERFALGQRDLRPVLGSLDLRVVERSRTDAGTRYRLRGERVRDEALLEAATPFHDPVDPRLTVTVTGDGLVRSYGFTYALADPPYISEERFVREFRVEAVGETTVNRPAWVPGNATETAGPGS